jgi:predicted ArsR family transcriptional regulator
MTELIASDRTADRLLFLLKTHGTLTTAELARRLGISVPAVRGHVARFAGDGLVTAETERGGVGRPAQHWSLTAPGHARFPDTHAETLVAVLEALRATLGERALAEVIAARSKETEAEYGRALAGCRSLAERLATLAALRSRDGYMAEVMQQDEAWILVENHCPICAAARSCQSFCRNELAMFRSLLGGDAVVTRTEYLLSGARRCTYLVQPKTRRSR